MGKRIKADHSQVFLLPPCVEDWVPSDHPARFIREFVNGLNLNELGFKGIRRDETGRPGYSSELMLSVWIFGCFQRIYSSRKLEYACRNEMALIWLTGMNYPDHNSIWRFWKEHKSQIKSIFKQTVLVADKMGMIGMTLNAIDGTKIQTVSSRKTLWRKSSLSEKLEMLDEQISRIEQEVEEYQNDLQSSMNLPEKLTDAKKLRESITNAISFLEAEGINNYHPNEPDAKVMKNQRVLDPCYNAQIVVDAKSQIITAETTVNEENDNKMLIPMLELVKENLGKVAEENLADSGYQTEKAIHKAAESGYEVLINDPRRTDSLKNPFHASHFEYDEKRDTVICPKGTELKFEQRKKGRPSQDTIMVFRCKNKDCPFRNQCTKDRRGRAIEITQFRMAVQNQNQKRNTVEGKRKLKLRGVVVEPVFAAIKSIRAFTRFTFKSLEKAGIQWSFMCSIHNLKKIYAKWKSSKPENDPKKPSNQPKTNLLLAIS